MTAAKRLFLRKEPGKQSLAEWLVSVIHDDRFEMVMTFARAEILELRPTQPQMEGAELMLATLLTLPDSEETLAELPGPGLQHDMPEKQIRQPEPKKD